MSGALFPVDEALLASASERLRAHPGLRFLLGGAGSGKSSVSSYLKARSDADVIDMDLYIYGTWDHAWDPRRHPVSRTWAGAGDPLAWQLALEPEAFLQFHAAATVEALDLLAAELEGDDRVIPIVVDGGFGSLGMVARAVGPDPIVCLSLANGGSEAVWTADPDRRRFLDVVASVDIVPDPVARFLALDTALSARMVEEAREAGVAVIERAPGTPLESTARDVAVRLGLG